MADKPTPYSETKTLMNFIDMKGWIDDKYGIDARDYANSSGFGWVEFVTSQGIDADRAKVLYSTSPTDVTDEAERAAMDAAALASKQWREDHPYQDFWHFQLENVVHLNGNDSYSSINLEWQLEAAKEDWQKEIAQMWLDEFGEFADEYGDIQLWVSW